MNFILKPFCYKSITLIVIIIFKTPCFGILINLLPIISQNLHKCNSCLTNMVTVFNYSIEIAINSSLLLVFN